MTTFHARRIGAGLQFLTMFLCALVMPVQAATFVVNRSADGSDAMPGDGICAITAGGCTLRAAVEEANALAGTDLITVPGGSFGLELGQLEVTSDLTIDGAGATLTSIDGHWRSRVLNVSGGVTVTVSDLTVQRGETTDEDGGGIFNSAASTVMLTRDRILYNRARNSGTSAWGGGLYNAGTATLTDVVVRSNRAVSETDEGDGGGIYNEAGATMSITNGTISQNRISCIGTTSAYGGGIENLGDLTLNGVLITRNRVVGLSSDCLVYGGGIDTGYTAATLMGTNVTIRSNWAVGRYSDSYGGGLSATGFGSNTTTLNGVTITTNRSTGKSLDDYADGGGIYVDGGHTVTVSDASIRANRTVGGAGANGGGISVFNGSLMLSDSLVSLNLVVGVGATSNPAGGGIAIYSGSTATISDTVIGFNRATGPGAADGGLTNGGSVTLTNVTLSGNTP